MPVLPAILEESVASDCFITLPSDELRGVGHSMRSIRFDVPKFTILVFKELAAAYSQARAPVKKKKSSSKSWKYEVSSDTSASYVPYKSERGVLQQLVRVPQR